jgi:type III pantothenate kinase
MSELNISIPFGVLNEKSKLPFINLYKTPETLGRDRIAAVAAASVKFPKMPVLIFDIGTCMTIDFINESNEYMGGNISPGVNMRLKAMNLLTDKLPLSSKEYLTDFLGDSTLSALANGAVEGLCKEIDGYIVNFKLNYPKLKVVFCGGDAIFF